MTSLTPAQLNELKSGFKMFDKDGNGKIDPHEIRKVIKKFDATISDKDIDELIVDLDKNNDGLVDFNEFANQFGKKFYTRHPRAELEAAFKYFDKDGSGFIDENELFQVVKQFNPNFSKDNIKKMISKIDKDHSGKVSIDEFIALMSK